MPAQGHRHTLKITLTAESPAWNSHVSPTVSGQSEALSSIENEPLPFHIRGGFTCVPISLAFFLPPSQLVLLEDGDFLPCFLVSLVPLPCS